MKKVCLFTLALVCLATAVYGEVLEMTLDYYPPFEYEENGETKGIGTDVVKAVLKEAGMEAKFTQYPFARAYKMVTEGKEPVFYYSLVRTPERESLVHWVGVVTSAEQMIMARKDKNIRIEKIEDLKDKTVGTVIDDVIDQYLRKHEASLNLKLDRVADYEPNVNKLMKGRFDMIGINQFVCFYLLEKLGYSKEDVSTVYVIDDLKKDFYLAANKNVPDDVVKKLQAAFATVHGSGTYQKIVDEYFGKPEPPVKQ